MTTFHMARWHPGEPNSSTSRHVIVKRLIGQKNLSTYEIVVVCQVIPEMSALKETRLALSVKRKAIQYKDVDRKLESCRLGVYRQILYQLIRGMRQHIRTYFTTQLAQIV